MAILVEADSRGVFGLEIVSLYKRLSKRLSRILQLNILKFLKFKFLEFPEFRKF